MCFCVGRQEKDSTQIAEMRKWLSTIFRALYIKLGREKTPKKIRQMVKTHEDWFDLCSLLCYEILMLKY